MTTPTNPTAPAPNAGQSTAHTPGPWRYHLGRGANPRFHVQTTAGYQIASTIELKTQRTVTRAVEFEENAAIEANARLIASAPELLAALERALPALERDCLTASENGALIEARAAIANAKGAK